MLLGASSPLFPSFLFAIMIKYYSAIAFGMAAGLLIGVAGQKHMNAMARDTCNRMPDYHRLITMRSWIGDASHCMHIRYLGQ